jgi:hypothetical protein
MFTMYFGKVKGQAERKLLDLAKSTESLEVVNVRPNVVDWSDHAEIQGQMKERNSNLGFRSKSALFSVLGIAAPSMLTPTKLLGQFLTDLALGRRTALKGRGVLENGGIVSNAGMLRIIKEDSGKTNS